MRRRNDFHKATAIKAQNLNSNTIKNKNKKKLTLRRFQKAGHPIEKYFQSQ